MGVHTKWNILNRSIKTAILFGILAIMMAFSASALDGSVDTDVLRVRAATSTESEEVGRVKRDEVLDITGRYGEWYVINYKGEARYVFTEYVAIPENIDVHTTMGVITGGTVNIREDATTGSKVVTKLAKGTAVLINGFKDGWYEISYLDYDGYVRGDYLEVLSLTYSQSDPVVEEVVLAVASATIDIVDDSVYSGEISAERQELLDYAHKFLGTPYKYGGATPDGFDCSGFTYYVFGQFGYSLNRSSASQINNGDAIEKSELIPGDLVFFSRSGKAVGHVGIYIGDGKFIHSTSPGDVVSITGLDDTYYAKRYVGARRILEV